MAVEVPPGDTETGEGQCVPPARWNWQLRRCIGGPPGGAAAPRDPDQMPCPSGQCKDTVTGECRSFNAKREKVNMTDTWERSAGPDYAGREATSGGRGYCRKLDPKPEAAAPATASHGGGGGTVAPVSSTGAVPSSQLQYGADPLMNAMAELFNNRAGIFGTRNPFMSSATSRAPGTVPTTAATIGPNGEVIPPKEKDLEGLFLNGGGLWWGEQGTLANALAPLASIFTPGGGAAGGGGGAVPFAGGDGSGGTGGAGGDAIPPGGCRPNVMYKVGHPCARSGAAPLTKVLPGTGGTIPPGGCNPNVMYKVGHPCANQGILAGSMPGQTGGPLATALFSQGMTF